MSNVNQIGNGFSSNKPYLFRALYEWILDNNGTPYLLVDTNKANVQVPHEHIKNGQIVLNASPDAVQSWCVENKSISFSARFSGKAQYIYIPMDSLLAIYAQENGLGMAFPEDEIETTEEGMEESENNQIEKSNKSKHPDGDKSNPKKNTSHLKIIK